MSTIDAALHRLETDVLAAVELREDSEPMGLAAVVWRALYAHLTWPEFVRMRNAIDWSDYDDDDDL